MSRRISRTCAQPCRSRAYHTHVRVNGIVLFEVCGAKTGWRVVGRVTVPQRHVCGEGCAGAETGRPTFRWKRRSGAENAAIVSPYTGGCSAESSAFLGNLVTSAT